MSPERSRRADSPDLFSVAQIQHVLRVEFGRAQRYRYPLSVLVLSVDQLGALRDRRGFEVKEALVEAVALLLAEATRTSDFLGRTPDDRLLAVVPHTGADGARRLGERLLERVRELRIPGLPEERLTLSVGAITTGEGDTLYHDTLLVAAEAAQAEALEQGGDRCVLRAPVAPR